MITEISPSTIAAAVADLLEPEPEGEERTILQWAKGDCDSCHCEFQAGRSRVRVVTRLICEECEMYKKGRIDGVRELAAALAKPADEEARRAATHAALHPTGQCSCSGEGTCEWCVWRESNPCRRCTECPELSHHWMVKFDDGTWEHSPEPRPVWGCKHCAFVMPFTLDDNPEDDYQAEMLAQHGERSEVEEDIERRQVGLFEVEPDEANDPGRDQSWRGALAGLADARCNGCTGSGLLPSGDPCSCLADVEPGEDISF